MTGHISLHKYSKAINKNC